MSIHKHRIDGREFWFSIERPSQPDAETGEPVEAPGYYCTFSVREPSSTTPGEIIKDDRGRARLFKTEKAALEGGIKEVAARLRLPARAFAVGLPGGTTTAEFETYVRLLREEALDTDAKPRVEDSFGHRWLHVWEIRDSAEQFAARLRKQTRNPNWEVYELSPPAEESTGRPEPIEILVGRRSDGNTYSLHPRSAKLLRRQFPQIRTPPTVFIGRNTYSSHGSNWETIYDQVVRLLTGLSSDQLLEAFGSYRVVDPVSDLTLWEAIPAIR